MSNNYFNFKIPKFQADYGTDWEDFVEYMDFEVDHIFERTFALYMLTVIDKMPNSVVNILINLLGINTSVLDSAATRRGRLRAYGSVYTNKGLAEHYLDLCETVTGVYGWIKRGDQLSGATQKWGTATWDESKWGGEGIIFTVYIYAGTSSTAEEDAVFALLRDRSIKPAFYVMFLVDVSENIIGVV